MAICEGKLIITKEEIEKTENGKTVIVPVRVFTRTYPCRQQVVDRQAWPKFGEVKDTVRGKHHVGDFSQDMTVKIMTNTGEVKEEIELVKQFKNLNTQTIRANKQLRELNNM